MTGIYIHIPFCAKKCGYCDFVSTSDGGDLFAPYAAALVKEIMSYGGQNIAADTVFIGGGTPSVFPIEYYKDVFAALKSAFLISEGSEITFEANPESLTEDFLRKVKALGANRLSIGVQSFCDAELSAAGRLHNAAQAKQRVGLAAKFFKNLSIDLILGLPEQTMDSLRESLSIAAELPLKHISVYALKVEEGTPLFTAGYARGDGYLREAYDFSRAYLSGKGFDRYEVSNFCSDGYECRHNLKYWRYDDYIGLGAAAHGKRGNTRTANTSDIRRYIGGDFPAETATLSEKDRAEEYLFLKLRLEEGLNLTEYRKLFNIDLTAERAAAIDKHLKTGALTLQNQTLKISNDFFFVMNGILADLI